MKRIGLGIAFAAMGLVTARVAAATDWDWDMLKAKGEVVEAWQDMRFGMFICWGPVTVTGLEIGWSRGKARPDQKEGGGGPTPAEVYDSFYKKWQPDKFDARQWVQVAQDAGARYIIFLVKHHDGFCLYDTKLTDYRSTGPESAWKVDVLKAMADASHEAGIKLVVYYSQPDWHHPDYRTANHARYIQYLHGQIREILTDYGRIDGLWFDLGGRPEDWDSETLFKTARQLQPHLIINNRCGLPGDFDTPEQRLGRFQIERPWETCMTLGTQWSWKPDDAIKSLKECVDALVTCAVRGGNLALNTNPMPDGQIEPRQAAQFRQIGQWLKKYGESIYGTRGGPFRSSNWGGATHRGDTVYVHVLAWPGQGVTLPPIPKKIIANSLLTGGTAAVKQTDEGIAISVPPGDRRELDTIIALKLDGPAGDIKPIPNRSGSLTYGKKAAASSVWGPGFEPETAFDDDEDTTRWGAAPGSRSGWLDVDLGAETTFSRAVVNEEGWNRIEEFELQSWDGASWSTFARGAQAGRLELKFNPVTARRVRLNILKANDVPTIWEFQLFKD
jgi:alpha-L-fucosidase